MFVESSVGSLIYSWKRILWLQLLITQRRNWLSTYTYCPALIYQVTFKKLYHIIPSLVYQTISKKIKNQEVKRLSCPLRSSERKAVFKFGLSCNQLKTHRTWQLQNPGGHRSLQHQGRNTDFSVPILTQSGCKKPWTLYHKNFEQQITWGNQLKGSKTHEMNLLY